MDSIDNRYFVHNGFGDLPQDKPEEPPFIFSYSGHPVTPEEVETMNYKVLPRNTISVIQDSYFSFMDWVPLILTSLLTIGFFGYLIYSYLPEVKHKIKKILKKLIFIIISVYIISYYIYKLLPLFGGYVINKCSEFIINRINYKRIISEPGKAAIEPGASLIYNLVFTLISLSIIGIVFFIIKRIVI